MEQISEIMDEICWLWNVVHIGNMLNIQYKKEVVSIITSIYLIIFVFTIS